MTDSPDTADDAAAAVYTDNDPGFRLPGNNPERAEAALAFADALLGATGDQIADPGVQALLSDYAHGRIDRGELNDRLDREDKD